jgi:beta-propeller repeat-containing protein
MSAPDAEANAHAAAEAIADAPAYAVNNKVPSRFAFLNFRVLFLVPSLGLAAFVMLLAGITTRASTCDYIGRVAMHMRTADRLPTGYVMGVRQAWVAEYNGVFDEEPTAMAVDDSGNVYVTGYSGEPDHYFYVTVKYDTFGHEEWVTVYSVPMGIGAAAAIAVDHSGNVYVTGTSGTFGSADNDYATIKYNSLGQQQWVARYNGPGNSSDAATAIAVDDSGNVYVTGTSGGDYATVKYDSSGQQQWVMRYNGPGNAGDNAVAIAIDSLGNVYVTGSSAGSDTGSDYATIKYNHSGEQQWVARYNRAGNGGDDSAGLAIDALGNVYVTGTSFGSRGISISQFATIKYNNLGDQQWVATYDGPGNGSEAAGIGIDRSGNVYVTGRSLGLDNISNYATVKYNSAGQQQWASLYRAAQSSGDFATAIAVAGSGNVYVTGTSWLSSGADYATIKYNSAGQQQWVARFDGPEGFDDYARAIGLDRLENVYVTGASHQDPVQYDWEFATIKYVPDRVPQPHPRPIP